MKSHTNPTRTDRRTMCGPVSSDQRHPSPAETAVWLHLDLKIHSESNKMEEGAEGTSPVMLVDKARFPWYQNGWSKNGELILLKLMIWRYP